MRIIATLALAGGLVLATPVVLAQDGGYDLCPQPPLLGGTYTCTSLPSPVSSSSGDTLATASPATSPVEVDLDNSLPESDERGSNGDTLAGADLDVDTP
jgi:hypothetical protein